MSAKNDLKKLIANHRRRLQKLKERQALEGLSVDPTVLIEIEDIEARLLELQRDLSRLERGLHRASRPIDASLSARQAAMLSFIKAFIAETGLSPTIEEIRSALNISSKSVVHHHLKYLEKAGYLTRLPHKSRGIRLT